MNMATNEHIHYDVCVVGAGLFGSAAARHLVEMDPSLTVALIGPDEPKDRSKVEILGAWHDEGRITSMLDLDPTWGLLAKRAINRYHDLEKKSGIKFYNPVGFLVLDTTGVNTLPKVKKCAEYLQVETKSMQSPDLKQKFPFLNFQPHHVGLYTETNSGHINPRKVVYAQQMVCRQNGCNIIKEVVDEISPSSSNTWSLKLASGQVIISKQVLAAVGAFSGFRSLFPGNVLPDVEHKGICHLLVEVKDEDLYKFNGMPAIIKDDNNRYTLLPPIKYPDGKAYIKLGINRYALWRKLNTPQQIQEWCMSEPDPKYEFHLLDIAKKFFSDLPLNNYKVSTNVTTFTSSGQLYCDMIAPNFGIVLGGCGFGAKSSDEIGYMAARMITKGEWDYDLPAQQFQFRAKQISSKL